MKYLSSSSTIALMAGFASSRSYVHSSNVDNVSSNHKSLSNTHKAAANNNNPHRNLQTEGPVTLQQLELIQYIIRLLNQATLPEGVDLTQVNVAIIITEVLQELGIDVSTTEIGDLSTVDVDLILQEIIERAAETLGVMIEAIANITNVTLPTAPPVITTEPSCVCSPLSYTFTLNLNRNCETDTFIDNPGISDTVCQDLPGIGLAAESADTLIVYDIQFLEVDTSGNLIVINQDDTYNNVSLTTGDTITFDSVSANLNPDEPLSSQLNYVPGGVLMKLVARNEGSDTIVRQQVSWLYTNSCDDLPTSVGDAIGWITLTDQTEASQAFCPVASPTTTMPTPSPTKTATESPTTAPVAATDSPTTSPTQSPTSAPVASTDAPTSSPTQEPTPSPVAATDSPTTSPTKSPIVSIQDPPTSSPTKDPTPLPTASPSKSPTLAPVPDPTKEPTLAPITSSPTQAKVPTTSPTPSPTAFGKAAKAKASKADPLAKVVKESSKSSKADTLAKAVKQGEDASTPAFAKAAKKTKQQEISSKSTSSYLISKGNKSQKESTTKSAKKQSSSADAKAQKISSKATSTAATDPLSMMV